ncbi:SH3 domain-containing protein [Streptomyces sp. ALI-76-A]|uniref:SH3 domain-containing protein n=1 Tax=Streptomyces sp. ALI-76-A TaxID=3025736 RepID=UPI00256EBA73|nr:SH3 domain-containing protein [Streptomyces sp. ALI-76-A]MDL5202727.1 SH3 domain-containing protein [Streptomyces sp. ALI-76-A]
MRTTPALRTLAAALFTGGTLVAATAGTAAVATTPPGYADGHDGGGSGGPIWCTVVSGTALKVRSAPTTHADVVDRLPPGTHDRVECKVRGQSVNGDPYWYWLAGAQGWAGAAFVGTGGHRVPNCADPCPRWKDGGWHNPDGNDPGWSESWAVSASVSWSASGAGSWSSSDSWSWSVTGSSSGAWDRLPVGR